MGVKKILLILAALVSLLIGWLLISPLFIVVEVQELPPVGIPGEKQVDLEVQASQVPAPSSAMVKTAEQKDPTKTVALTLNLLSKQTLAKGSFVPDAHRGEGNAMFLEIGLNKTLRFENFKVDNGPDLRVYLATDAKATEFVDIGALKGTKGNFNMDIKDDVDLRKYRWVLIWCRAFGVLFSHAALE